MNPGILYATLAYVIWGLFPLYFRQLAAVPALEVIAHRTVWSLVFVLGLLAWRGQWGWLRGLRAQPRVLGAFALSALLLSCNWLLYVWAVLNAQVVEASLGYFILPLMNVAMGYLVLHERPRQGQWLAVALAAAGVAWLALKSGQPPWLGLALAVTFGIYGLIRKTAALGALEGLALETLWLTPLALLAMAWWTWQGQGAFHTADAPLWGWLLLAGPITAIPLLCFAAGARRIPMATLGLLQYIGPSLLLLLGVGLYGEPLAPARLVGFLLIWAALLVYTLESLWMRGRKEMA